MQLASRGIWFLSTFSALAAMGYSPDSQTAPAASTGFREYTIIHSELSDSPAPISVGRKSLEAQRADGSRVSGEVILKGDEIVPPTLRNIQLVPDQMRIKVDDALKAKTTMYMPGPAPTRPPAPDPQCGISHLAPSVKPTLIGQQEILDYKTVGIQTEMQDPDQSFLTKVWRAPDLDCAILRMTEVRRDPAGKTIGEFRYEAMKVTLGPPAPELFVVPQGYEEQSPSQMESAYMQLVGGADRPIPENVRKRLEREDQRYIANHQAHDRQR